MQPPSLSILVNPPLWVTIKRFLPFSLTYPMNYQHTITALGGYWSMSWNVVGKQIDIEDWLSDGLGRHIEVYDDALNICFEGFVNQVSASMGPLSVVRGPFLDIGNRLYVIYTNVYSLFDPPANGTRDATPVANDTDSQSRWGIQYKIMDGGPQTELTALYLRDFWLTEMGEPVTTQSYGTGGTEMSATIECLGYWHLFNYPYNQVLLDGDIDVSHNDGTGKMQLIITADPNNIFSHDYSNMSNNTMQVPQWENQDNLANSLLQTLTNLGDTSHNRYVCGIYAGRKCHYNAAPTDTAYYQYLLDPQQRITTPMGMEVKPWNVLPGRWVFYPDRNVGRTIPTTRRLDDRFEFIESVTYNSESNPPVSHTGGRTDRLPQLLARWSMLEI